MNCLPLGESNITIVQCVSALLMVLEGSRRFSVLLPPVPGVEKVECQGNSFFSRPGILPVNHNTHSP